ncbi:hypothetical protein C440_13214 [Haloferax mucosum ATCC BAA-1512]|uniref:Tat (Twin-arginine translocation) pathway signal sequence n=1 Tax=Haloferax mucosum ATCC BAA-1512 TaxID=662479 RepID=M0I3A5_9EURY|nr:gluconate 2-dehydrogenase subunit 3 family protein [Haloferax mucosum]ELZ91275.1 hypothetical protein C440_13214 [Haloferax mucosum ATCC BAA-1512]
MRLTRRDALAVLAGLGITGGALGLSTLDPTAADGDGSSGDRDPAETDLLATMTAAAEVVYPSQVTGVGEFVETYVTGRSRDASRQAAMETVVSELDEIARDWHGAPFADLAADDRDDLLRELGVADSEPVPEGNVSERVRFYVVNELLYAFYASPTGGRLVGIENPIGHAGGTDSYQRAAMDGGQSDVNAGENDG